MRTVSLAITHFNRLLLLMDCLTPILDDDRISEIVISDDQSTDGSYEAICNRFRSHPKVRVFRNEENLDCYRNKERAVSKCTNPWVILLDSDNIIGPDYLDVLFSLEQWEPKTVYTPDFAHPHFNFQRFSGEIVTRQNVAHLMGQPSFSTMLNAANYLVPRDHYCASFDPEVDPHTSDSIFMAYQMLCRDGRFYVTPGLQYFHRIHPGSHYKQNHHKTGMFAQWLEAKLHGLE